MTICSVASAYQSPTRHEISCTKASFGADTAQLGFHFVGASENSMSALIKLRFHRSGKRDSKAGVMMYGIAA